MISESNPPTLWPTLSQLKKHKFIDLTHTFDSEIPHWGGVTPETRTILHHYDPGIGTIGTGILIEKYCIPGQWGTHVDPPSHFIKGKRSVDEIDVREMFLPLVIIDVSKKVEKNCDYVISMDDIREWEEKYHCKIPEDSFVAMRTDWSKRWPNSALMENKDENGIAHYPGWGLEVLKYLYEERNITASGHETTDTDPGLSTSKNDYKAETYILSQNKYQIELLTNLHEVPEYGSIAVVAFPKPKKGSGFPARVFAIIP